jgi:hypothetical protein
MIFCLYFLHSANRVHTLFLTGDAREGVSFFLTRQSSCTLNININFDPQKTVNNLCRETVTTSHKGQNIQQGWNSIQWAEGQTSRAAGALGAPSTHWL